MDKNQKLCELFSNEQFKAEANKLSTAEELQRLFSEYGLELSIDEVYDLCEVIAVNMEKEELDEGDLESVAGGFAITAGLVVLGVACIGAVALGIYNGYKKTKRSKK